MFGLKQKFSHRLARHLHTSTAAARDFGPIVSFTFDDAPVSSATQGAPILEDEGVRGAYYLSGAMIGGHSDIQPVVSAAQVRDLAQKGHEIACHTFDHLELCRQSSRALAADLDKNRETLAALSGVDPTNFAYPYGRAPFSAKRMLQSRFKTCRGIYPGINVGKIDLGLLHAVALYDCRDDAEVLRWIEAAVERRGWLIFVTHDVQDEPTRFGTAPKRLKSYVRAAQQAGCACVTIEGAVKRILNASKQSAPGEVVLASPGSAGQPESDLGKLQPAESRVFAPL